MMMDDDSSLEDNVGWDTKIDSICAAMLLPPEIALYYKKRHKIEDVYAWQAECIYTTNVSKGGNLLYSAPTGGGKSLIAELAVLMQAITLRKKAIFVLPFVSLVVEKEAYFKSIAKHCNRLKSPKDKLIVKSYYGDISWHKNGLRENIIVCTIDKANGILNTLISRNMQGKLGCIAIDEVHMLGESFNGHIIESLVSKVRYLQTRFSSGLALLGPQAFRTQLLAMSATVGNLPVLARWLGAELFVTNFRPVQLVERVIAGGKMYDGGTETLIEDFPNHFEVTVSSSTVKQSTTPAVTMQSVLISLCVEAIAKNQQVLIFCPTKQSCEDTCKALTSHLVALNRLDVSDNASVARNRLAIELQELGTSDSITRPLAAKIDHSGAQLTESTAASSKVVKPPLIAAVQVGVAYHHAGITSQQRTLLEQAYKAGTIRWLFATSTLAAGVNLPAGRVIVRSMRIGREFLGIGQYKQMVGRAGRAGYSSDGESYLLVEPSELPIAFELVRGVMPPVRSQLLSHLPKENVTDTNSALKFVKLITEVSGLNICRTVGDFIDFIASTLLGAECEPVHDKAPLNLDVLPKAVEHLEQLVLGILTMLFRADALLIQTHLSSSTTEASITSVSEFSTTFLARESIISPTQFGRALLQCGLATDEAIVIYQQIYIANKHGIDLSSNLHLLVLVIPPDHNFVPDFSRLLKWCDYQLLQERQISDHYARPRSLCQLLGIRKDGHSYGLLERWAQMPPPASDISQCFSMERLCAVDGSWDELDSFVNQIFAGAASGKEGIIRDSHRSKTSIQRDKNYWTTLGLFRRLWAAIVLDDLTKGKPIAIASKELSVLPSDCLQLQYSTRVQCGRVERLCDELGWSSLVELLKVFRTNVLVHTAKGCESLLSIPYITPKLALMLNDINIHNAKELAVASVQDIAIYLHLKMCFEPKDIYKLSGDEVDDTTAVNSFKKTEDELMRERLETWIAAVVGAARTYVEQMDAIHGSSVVISKDVIAIQDSSNPPSEDSSDDLSVATSTSSDFDSLELSSTDDELGTDFLTQVDFMLSQHQNSIDTRPSPRRDFVNEAIFARINSTDELKLQDGNNILASCSEPSKDMRSLRGKVSLDSMNRLDDDSFYAVNQEIERFDEFMVEAPHKAARLDSNDKVHRFPNDSLIYHNELNASQIGAKENIPSTELLELVLSQTSRACLEYELHFSTLATDLGISKLSSRSMGIASMEILVSPNIPVATGPPKVSVGHEVDQQLMQRQSVNSVSYELNHDNLLSVTQHSINDSELLACYAQWEDNSRGLVVEKPEEILFPEKSDESDCDSDEKLWHEIQAMENNPAAFEINCGITENRFDHYDLLPTNNSVEFDGSDLCCLRLDLPSIGSPVLIARNSGNEHCIVNPGGFSIKAIPTPETALVAFSNSPEDRNFCLVSEEKVDNVEDCPLILSSMQVLSDEQENDMLSVYIHGLASLNVPSSPGPFEQPTDFFVGTVLPEGEGLKLQPIVGVEVSSSVTYQTIAVLEPIQSNLIDPETNLSADNCLTTSASVTIRPGPLETPRAKILQNDSTVKPLIRSKSPYSTPFSISNPYTTPGQIHAYYPVLEPTPVRVQNQELNFECDPSSSTMPEPLAGHLCSAERVCVADSKGFSWKHISDDDNCRSFLQRVYKCTCFSFELHFRRLPQKASLHDWHAFVSKCCTKDAADHLVACERQLQGMRSGSGSGAVGSQSRVVLGGIAINFGDPISYYVPLPCPLPLRQWNISSTIDTSIQSSLDRLPKRAMILIARFVGFPTILSKCQHLQERLGSRNDKQTSQLPLRTQSSVSNPLLVVSKHWAMVSRLAIRMEWRSGACFEWRLINELMSNARIAKVAVNMKAAICVLRERDIVIRGALEDPVIAAALLHQAGGLPSFDTNQALIDRNQCKVTAIAETDVSCSASSTLYNSKPAELLRKSSLAYSCLEYPTIDLKVSRGQPNNSVNEWKCCCFRACATMRSMARLSLLLRESNLLPLFINIEMPVLHCVAETEFCGLPVDIQNLITIDQSVSDRIIAIEQLFAAAHQHESFGNLSNPSRIGSIRPHLITRRKDKLVSMFDGNLGSSNCTTVKSSHDRDLFIVQATNQAEREIEFHPLLLLHKEHQMITKSFGPLCASILSHVDQGSSRVRAHIQSLGTETGRMCFRNPPVQMIPKQSYECRIPTVMSLHEELKIAEARNEHLKTVLNDLCFRGRKFPVVAICLPAISEPKCGRQYQRKLRCHLVRICDENINEPPVVPFGNQRSTDNALKSLAEQWAQRGIFYSEYDRNSMRQILVSIDSANSMQSLERKPQQIYAFPADQVCHLKAAALPHPAESASLLTALEFDEWTELYHPPENDSLQQGVTSSPAANSVTDDHARPPSIVFNLRSIISASPGFVLVAADYSQIELRLLAHFSGDINLLRSFEGSGDIFRKIAVKWLQRESESSITANERDAVKQLCYANIYGCGANLIAENAAVTVATATKWLRDFRSAYPGIGKFIEHARRECHRRGGRVITLLGRQRLLPGVLSKDREISERANRQVINSICQGSAADLLKLALITIHRRLSELSVPASNISYSKPPLIDEINDAQQLTFRRPYSYPGGALYKPLDSIRPILQVHDEVVFEVPIAHLHTVANLITDCMVSVANLRVPLSVKVKWGHNWEEMKPLNTD